MAKYVQPGARRAISTNTANFSYSEYECGIHDLTYKAFRPGCPACEADRAVSGLRQAVTELRNRVELIEAENHKLKTQVDLIYSIREAVNLLNEDDLAFLKAVLYEWRDNKSVALKTTHGARKKRGAPNAANGFIVMPRKGDPYAHACTSMGGLAIAAYFDEAVNWAGPAQGMSILTRGLAELLPGRA